MLFSDVFDALARKYGFSEAHSAAGGDVTLLFDGLHAVTFQCDADDKSVLFLAEICDLTDVRGDRAEMLLEASLLGAQTGGAAFALSLQLGKVVLWKRHDDCFADENALEQAINTFLAAVITWKGRLASDAAGEADKQDAHAWQMRV
ncbi:MAG: type III secretion system chaperone [Desulfovibrio sp.]|nr:type III secretion system chaperone [Desulfovibrio sp.]